MDKSYKAVVVCTDPECGVLFAKRADSKKEAYAILGEDIVRLCDDFDGDVIVSAGQDAYDEVIIEAVYQNKQNKLEYKICFEKDEENDSD